MKINAIALVFLPAILFQTNLLKAKEVEKTEIVAESSVLDEENHRMTFSGGVTFRHGTIILECDELIVSLRSEVAPNEKKADQKNHRIEKAEATGAVSVTLRDGNGAVHTGSSGQAFFDPEAHQVVLSERPKVKTGNKLIQGEQKTTITLSLERDVRHTVKGTAHIEIKDE